MVDNPQKSDNTTPQALSEAERMARIRELLVAPVVADESARVGQSLERLERLLSEQVEKYARLSERLKRLESEQRADARRLDLRLLGVVDALLTDENGLRARVAGNELLRPQLSPLKAEPAELDQSG